MGCTHLCVSTRVYTLRSGYIHSAAPLCFKMQASAALRSWEGPHPDSTSQSSRRAACPHDQLLSGREKPQEAASIARKPRKLHLLLWLLDPPRHRKAPGRNRSPWWSLSFSDPGEQWPHLLLCRRSPSGTGTRNASKTGPPSAREENALWFEQDFFTDSLISPPEFYAEFCQFINLHYSLALGRGGGDHQSHGRFTHRH